jgi:hypothetical protein
MLRFCVALRFLRELDEWAFVGVLALLTFYFLVWRLVFYSCTTYWRLSDTRTTTRNRVLLLVTIYLGTLVVILSSLSAYYLGKDEEFVSQRISLARSVQPSDLAYLMVQADPAFVTWLQVPGQEPPAPPSFPAASDRVMYLGHSNNVAVIHDPGKLRTWRVPGKQSYGQHFSALDRPYRCQGHWVPRQPTIYHALRRSTRLGVAPDQPLRASTTPKKEDMTVHPVSMLNEAEEHERAPGASSAAEACRRRTGGEHPATRQ